MKESNPYVKQANVFLAMDQGEQFVIGHIDVVHDYQTPENPEFLHNKALGARPVRLGGFRDGRTTRLVYHAESDSQAQAILQVFRKGEGYSINDCPVHFEQVPEPLPPELANTAAFAIRKYREIQVASRR